MVRISAVIITHNEEQNIARCISSVTDIVDEIVVVDSYSDDRTTEVAERYGARILYHHFRDFGDQKTFAIQQAANDWILSIDADEVLSPELQQSILKEKEAPRKDGYNINILANY